MAVYFIDLFTDTNSTNLESHTPTLGTSWTKNATQAAGLHQIQTNKGKLVSTTRSYYMANTAVGSVKANYVVQCEIRLGFADANEFASILVRLTENTYPNITAYGCGIGNTTAATGKAFFKVWRWSNAACNTPTAELFSREITSEYDGTTEKVCAIAVEGTLITAWFDHKVEFRGTDANISAAGKAGINGKIASTGRTATWDVFGWTDIEISHLLEDDPMEVMGVGNLSPRPRNRRRTIWVN